MYVHLHDTVVCHTYNGIADGLQISLEIHLCLDVECLVQHDDEFRAVAELDLHLRLRLPLAGSLAPAGGLDGQIQLLAQERVECAGEHRDEPLPAGIHHAGLLQHWKHLRSLAQHIFRMGDDGGEEGLHIRTAVLHKRLGLLRRSSGNGEDRALLGLHDSLVGSLHGLVQGFRKDGDCQALLLLDTPGEAAEEL